MRGLTGYDPGNGQVYLETTVSVQRDSSTWRFQPSNPMKRIVRSGGKIATLKEVAVAKLLENLLSIAPCHLSGVPWMVGQQIWAEVSTRRLKTLHVWQVFAEAYPEEFRGPRNRYRLVIGGPALPLLEYLNGMMSAALSWMTLLSISTSIAQKQDLIHLAKLRNLVALDLAVDSPKSLTVPSSLDTRIIRTWSELADSEDAFKHLHVLMIRGQTDVSPMLFEYLSKLPSLRLLIMQSYPHSQRKTKQLWARVALTCGWAVEQASHQSLTAFKVQDEQDDFEPERTQHKNAFKDDYDLKSRLSGQPLDLLRRLCYGSPSSVSQGTAIDGEAITSLPFIECRIGKPVGFETASSLVADDVLVFRRTDTGLKSSGRSLQTISVKVDGKRKSTLVHHLAHLPKRPAMKPSARTVEGLLSDFRAV